MRSARNAGETGALSLTGVMVPMIKGPGPWARAGARAWAAARLVMLAGALAVGGTLGLLLAAMRLYSWLRHSGP